MGTSLVYWRTLRYLKPLKMHGPSRHETLRVTLRVAPVTRRVSEKAKPAARVLLLLQMVEELAIDVDLEPAGKSAVLWSAGRGQAGTERPRRRRVGQAQVVGEERHAADASARHAPRCASLYILALFDNNVHSLHFSPRTTVQRAHRAVERLVRQPGVPRGQQRLDRETEGVEALGELARRPQLQEAHQR